MPFFYKDRTIKVFEVVNDIKIIHRGIKPENILIKKVENNKYLYKLTDYGLSKQLSENHKSSAFAGTIDYIAPEIKNELIYGAWNSYS